MAGDGQVGGPELARGRAGLDRDANPPRLVFGIPFGELETRCTSVRRLRNGESRIHPFPAELVYSALATSAVLLPTPVTAAHSNNAKNELYRLKRLSNAVPTTAVSSVGVRRPVSSKEVRVSLPSRKSSDGEPRSRPVTRTRGESIVTAPISATGNAECCFSEDMDKTMFEDLQVKGLPSIPESVSITPSMLDKDATSREGSIK